MRHGNASLASPQTQGEKTIPEVRKAGHRGREAHGWRTRAWHLIGKRAVPVMCEQVLRTTQRFQRRDELGRLIDEITEWTNPWFSGRLSP